MLLMINLVAAKATRFKVSGKGAQLFGGIGLHRSGIALGFCCCSGRAQ